MSEIKEYRLQLLRNSTQNDEVTCGTMQIRYAASAVFDYVTKRSQPVSGIELGTGLIDPHGMEMSNSRKFSLLVRITAYYTASITKNTNDTAMFPVSFPLFIRKLNLSQQIFTHFHRDQEIILSKLLSMKRLSLQVAHKTGEGALFQLV